MPGISIYSDGERVAHYRSPYKPFGILRFILALMVLVQHFCDDIAPAAIRQAVLPWAPGNVAVLGFFVISGFIVCEAYHFNYRDRPVAYFKNRLLRIVPAYWAALAVSILMHFVILHYQGHLTSLDRHNITAVHFGFKNILMNIFGIFPPVVVNVTPAQYPFIPYAWALQTEMMFYLTLFIVGFFYQRTKKYTGVPQYAWLALAAYAGIIAAGLTQIGILPRQMAYGSYFAFGGALFFVLNGERCAWLVLVPAFAQMMSHFHTYAAEDFIDLAANRPGQLLLLILILAWIVVLAAARIRHTKIDKILGDHAYALYLNHYVVAVVILNCVDRFSVIWLAAGLAASLALTRVMFLVAEKPFVAMRKAIRGNE